MWMLEPLRAANRYVKAFRRARMGRHLSRVRRIERVYPPAGRRVVAMTFDDGPTASPARPGDGRGLTELILEALAKYGARGTFDVIGTTAGNYPDTGGKLGTPLWSGVKYDHYPEFGRDEMAGVVNQKALARRMVAEGHELSNHGYNHVAFGPSRIVYGSRGYLPDGEAVYRDLKRLHDLVREEFGPVMRLARPPHYIDGIAGGKNAYDVYARLNYNYLAASFDGGGWKPSSGNYHADVEAMVSAIRRALEKDPESLNGQIIFQKDGYNMSKESPVVDALPRQLEILRRHGYEVVTVSELLDMSPFVDVTPSAPYFEGVRALARAGRCIGFRDNSFKPDRPLTREELAALLAGPAVTSSPEASPEASPYPARDNAPRGKTVTAAEMVRALETLRALPSAVEGPDVSKATDLFAALPPGASPQAPVSRGWTAVLAARAFGLIR